MQGVEARLREALGEEAFEAAAAEGGALELADAVARALDAQRTLMFARMPGLLVVRERAVQRVAAEPRGRASACRSRPAPAAAVPSVLVPPPRTERSWSSSPTLVATKSIRPAARMR